MGVVIGTDPGVLCQHILFLFWADDILGDMLLHLINQSSLIHNFQHRRALTDHIADEVYSIYRSTVKKLQKCTRHVPDRYGYRIGSTVLARLYF